MIFKSQLLITYLVMCLQLREFLMDRGRIVDSLQ